MPRSKKPKKEPRSERLFLRLEPSLLRRIDAYQESMEGMMPGYRPTRSDVIRGLLHEALEGHEANDE